MAMTAGSAIPTTVARQPSGRQHPPHETWVPCDVVVE